MLIHACDPENFGDTGKRIREFTPGCTTGDRVSTEPEFRSSELAVVTREAEVAR